MDNEAILRLCGKWEKMGEISGQDKKVDETKEISFPFPLSNGIRGFAEETFLLNIIFLFLGVLVLLIPGTALAIGWTDGRWVGKWFFILQCFKS